MAFGLRTPKPHATLNTKAQDFQGPKKLGSETALKDTIIRSKEV